LEDDVTNVPSVSRRRGGAIKFKCLKKEGVCPEWNRSNIVGARDRIRESGKGR
jgi:hypothetical protein